MAPASGSLMRIALNGGGSTPVVLEGLYALQGLVMCLELAETGWGDASLD